MAIGPDPRDLAAKAALAKRYGATDAWGNRIGGDEEPDEGAYNIARRLVAADIAAKGGASPYRELDTLDKMLGDSPVKQMVFRPSEEPRVGIEKPVVRGPMGSAAYEMLKNKRDSAWNFATGQPGERTHAVGMEPDENETAGAPVVNAALHNPAVQEIAAKYGLSNEEAAKVAAKAGIGGGPDEIEGSAGADAFKQSVVVPGARPATPAPRIATINPNTDGMEATTRDGAQAMRHIAMRADPAYRAAIEARKANAQLPLSEQTSLPVRVNPPAAGDRSESAARYAGDGQPAQGGAPTLGDLWRQKVGPTQEGLQRIQDSRDQHAAARQLITSRARDSADARRDRMGLNPLPSWMLEGGRGMRDLAGDRTNLERDRLTAATQGQTAALDAQTKLANRQMDIQERQADFGRGDKLREERMQAWTAWQAAQKKAADIAGFRPQSREALQAQADADVLKSYHDRLMQETASQGGGGGGAMGQAARDMGFPMPAPQAPVPGPIQGVQSAPATAGQPAAKPEEGIAETDDGGPVFRGALGREAKKVFGMADMPKRHFIAEDAVSKMSGSPYDKLVAYMKDIGWEQWNNPAVQDYVKGAYPPPAIRDAKIYHDWSLGSDTPWYMRGGQLLNYPLMGIPRAIHQGLTD